MDGIPLYSRLNGAAGFRATLVFRLVIAANPFQAGVLRMVWRPQAADTFGGAGDHSSNTNLVSMLPGVNLDICEQTSAVLRVPYISDLNYWEIVAFDSDTSWGALTLFSYLPLTVASGGTAPTWTIFMHLEDIELIGASTPYFTTAVPQAPEDSEALKQDRPVSRLFSAGAVVARALGTIPHIAPIATAASWWLTAMSGAAYAFGWSKPLDISAPHRVYATQQAYTQNCNGEDIALNLGLFCDNHIVPQVGFAGSNVDELSLAFLLSKSGAICRGTIATTDAIQKVKYSFCVSPSSCVFQTAFNAAIMQATTTTTALKLCFGSTPLSYIGNCFGLWRGGMVLRFTCAKTKFHSGRYLIYFIPIGSDPNVHNATTATVAADATFQYHSVIWDLRESNTIEFSIPYLALHDYTRIDLSTGNVVMVALDPLQAPATVSPVVPFLVEVYAQPDFEFASPTTPVLIPAPDGSQYYAQSSESEPFRSTMPVTSAETCIGERVMSIKQLISKACGFHVTATGGGIQSISALVPKPTSWTLSSPIPYCHYFIRMYAYALGGTSVDITNFFPNSANFAYALNTFSSSSIYAGNCLSGDNFVAQAGNLHVRAPFYNYTSRALVSPALTRSYTNQNVVQCASAEAGALMFVRAAEDTQYGYFLGTPPLALIVAGAAAPTFELQWKTALQTAIP